MKRYRFSGLSDEFRLAQTMVDQSKIDHGEASWIIRNCLERCVEVWEGNNLCMYLVVIVRDGVRSFHGYNMTKGRARHAVKIALQFLKDEPKIYSCHKSVDTHVNRLLKILGFQEKARIGNEVILQR